MTKGSASRGPSPTDGKGTVTHFVQPICLLGVSRRTRHRNSKQPNDLADEMTTSKRMG